MTMRAIDIGSCARTLEVDDSIPLRHYYRIANNLLKQASIYRQERNLIDLYIILLRFSSLMCETIPSHRDYHNLHQNERVIYKKKLPDVINELESVKPDVQRQVDAINRAHISLFDPQDTISNNLRPLVKKQPSPRLHINKHPDTRAKSFLLSRKNNTEQNSINSFDLLDKRFEKLSLSLPPPTEETLSRHSVLGPAGLLGRRTEFVSGIKVQYPSSFDVSQIEISSQNQNETQGPLVGKADSGMFNSDMDSILSLNDGRWSLPQEESSTLPINSIKDHLQFNIRQPLPPPVLAEIQSLNHSIPPSKVADPRPGPKRSSQDELASTKEYKDLHVPLEMMKSFLRLAEMNTAKNLETCGVLAGSLKNRMFCVTTLIIPKQESTSDSCQTTDEEEIFFVQDKRSLIPLGWIHTHPTQTCFMSSIDLHTHYSYQIMLPEAVAIVMAPTDTSRTHGIFHLSDPAGVSVIKNCRSQGFHPHEEPADGSPIYEHCSHVYMNPQLKFDIFDLRKS